MKLPPFYRSHGMTFNLVEQLDRNWGLYAERGCADSYELVRQYKGRFPPKDDEWGTLGYTFTRSTHKYPLTAAHNKFLHITKR